MPKNRNISRIDIDEETGKAGTHGYEVRLMRGGETFHKFFGDVPYGGKRKALAAAREYRDKLVATLQPYSRKEVAQLKFKRNTSGIVGIRLLKTWTVADRTNWSILYWVAQWSPKPGVRKTRRFSVSKIRRERGVSIVSEST